MINIDKWADFKVSDIFELFNGKGLTIEEIETNPGLIPVIQGGEISNGVIGYIDEEYCKNMKYQIIREDFLSLARVGSAGTINFQPNIGVIGDKCKALILKQKKSRKLYLFLTTILNMNKYKYSYGRGIVSDKYMNSLIKLPVNNLGNPDWDYMETLIGKLEKINKNNRGAIKDSLETKNKQRKEINTILWKDFSLTDIFNIKKAYAYNKETFIENVDSSAKINCITRTGINNGCDYRGDYSEDLKLEKGNALTIGGEGIICFYQSEPFVCGTNMSVLRNKHLNQYTGMFLCSVINHYSNGRFSYGRAFNLAQIKKSSIKLPIDANGEPDWKFMEEYIKTLPFGDRI